MTTLNARANQAWHELVDRWGRERGTDSPWIGFDNQRDAFEEGWETGYKAKAAEQPAREQIALALDRMAFDAESRYYDTVGAERRREYALQKANAVLELLGGAS